MEHKIHKTERKGSKINLNILLKILTGFLLGFLSALIIFLFGLKIISSIWGALLGTIINIAATAYILKKHKNNKTLKTFAYGIISAVILMVIAYFSLSALVLTLFNGMAS